jgi:hypothetical protein
MFRVISEEFQQYMQNNKFKDFITAFKQEILMPNKIERTPSKPG